MTRPGAPAAAEPAGRRRAVHGVGDRALLVDCADGAEARHLHATLAARPLPGQGELLPGARTVLVHLTARAAADRRLAGQLARALAELVVDPSGDAAPAAPGDDVVLDTVYDGEDLPDVAALLGTTVAGVIGAHGDRLWTAAFVGFAPGFAYLEPDGAPFDVPRRASPRTAVPAGSVALAGPYSAVYPRSSPGGWQLVGRTDAVLWDLARPQPALLRAGTRVRFRPVRPAVVLGGRRAGARGGPEPVVGGPVVGKPVVTPEHSADRGSEHRHSADRHSADRHSADRDGPDRDGPDRGGPDRALEVVHPGALSLVEDLGRPGHLDLGVGASGALDRRAAAAANRLVGNPRGAAVVETVLGGLRLRAHGAHVLAVTGAPAPLVVLTVDGAPRTRPPVGAPFALHPGETLQVGDPPAGLRCYVAVRGGLGADRVLGSRSTDVLSGLGPPPLRAGDVVGVLPPPGDAVAAWPDPPDLACAGDGGGVVDVQVALGPRADRLTAAGRQRLRAGTWTVSPRSNRVGLRLDGDPLRLGPGGELPSEGVVAGAVQVPPSGLPVVFLADHPVTGGYPVVAVVVDADLGRLAQLRPGERLRLVAPEPALPPASR
ncbi:urea amidolyase family protein [uncultured Cellulomonas sp.]|uniref:5-oxoprolinase subunit B/C family protein n=1 Tax=uncultured Cellulomonas sp. TaxID=189682 RepID=UPI0026295B62|nr:urea amidolyase family protein [uncultured Cellulomonas sp.]